MGFLLCLQFSFRNCHLRLVHYSRVKRFCFGFPKILEHFKLTTQTEHVILFPNYNYMLPIQVTPLKSIPKNVLHMNGIPQIILANWKLCNGNSLTRLTGFYFLLH